MPDQSPVESCDADFFAHDFAVACEMLGGRSFEAAERRVARELSVVRGREAQVRGLPVSTVKRVRRTVRNIVSTKET